MDKQSRNHQLIVRSVIAVLDKNGIGSSQNSDTYYSRLVKDKDCCHLIIHGLTFYPLKIKTAFAESKMSNQAEGYVTKINRMKDEVIFIYAGDGWQKQSYLWALYDINNAIGKDHVFNLKQFESWVVDKLKEKANR
jgi:hypothetical protein